MQKSIRKLPVTSTFKSNLKGIDGSCKNLLLETKNLPVIFFMLILEFSVSFKTLFRQ